MQSGVPNNNLTVVGTIPGALQPDGTWLPGVSGSGMAAEDLLYTDDAGVQFVYRDSGATPPVFTAYRIPAGTLYTVGANPRPYAVRDVIVATSALPAGAATAAKQDSTNALLVKGQGTAAQSLSVVLSSDGPFSTNFGLQADTRGTWWDSVVSHIGLLKLLIAATVGAGSHVYTYSNGFLVTDAWTFLGVLHTKTYGNDGTNITTETDWV